MWGGNHSGRSGEVGKKDKDKMQKAVDLIEVASYGWDLDTLSAGWVWLEK